MINPKPYSLIELEGGARLAIAQILPSDTLRSEVSAAEIAEIESFVSEARKAERLTWRALLRRVLGIAPSVPHAVKYNALGAPHLIDSSLHLSVSHSRTKVAIILSPTPCAVDIDSVYRNFERVSSRFVSPAERELIATQSDLARIWCAKEALYKVAATAELSLIGDIEIVEIASEHLTGRVKGIATPITIKTMLLDEHIVAYIA